jgi:hypothetical protein
MKMKIQLTLIYDTTKAMLRGKFIATSAYIKKTETSQINNLMMYLKLLEKQQTKPKTRKWREIIRIMAKINEIETKQSIQRISETKSWFFKKINKINKLLANMIKQRWEKTQVNKIRDEKQDIIINTDEIQIIIRKHFERLHSSKLENLDEMDKFLGAYSQSKLNQEDTKHL